MIYFVQGISAFYTDMYLYHLKGTLRIGNFQANIMFK